MHKLIQKIQHSFPYISFIQSDTFHWSAESASIYYNNVDEDESVWSLLHELGHAVLDHRTYASDIELLRMEVAAWEAACKLSEQFEIVISQPYIDSCLDSYRDWLYKRSTCPTCMTHGIQVRRTRYRCVNCLTLWNISEDRFCRTYRKTSKKSLA